MGLESLPAQGAYRIAGVNGDDGEKQVKVVCAADGVPKFGAAELAEVQGSASVIQEIADDEKPERKQQPLPRLGIHKGRVIADSRQVKRRKGSNSNAL